MQYNKSVVSGHFVISFDNVINGFLAVVMAPLFFGEHNTPIIQLLSSYAAYAALFVTGPLGAIAFGRIGDKYGRKKSLLISIMGIGVPVFLIGLLPVYSSIGLIAPITLILLRMVQGFFKGSEYSGVLIHNYETGGRKTSSSANMVSFGCMGGCIAALVCWGITQDGAPIWFWRIPFLVGGLLAFIIFLFRIKIQETDDYIEILNKHKLSKNPIKDIIQHHRLETLVGIAISAAYTSVAYSSMMFGNRLFQQAGYAVSQSMIFSMFDLLWISISIHICGKIADRIGLIKQIKYGSLILAIMALPVCGLISGELNLLNIYTYMVIVTFLSASVASCSAAYVINLFPASCRYSGFAITDSLGAIIGGFTPFMMLLFSSIFNSNLGCAVWIYIITIPTFILISIMNKRLEKQNTGNN